MSYRQKQCAAVILFLIQEEKKKCWERDWIAKRKQNAGLYRELLHELKKQDAAAYENFLRISYSYFESLLQMVTPIIQKTHTCENLFQPEKD